MGVFSGHSTSSAVLSPHELIFGRGDKSTGLGDWNDGGRSPDACGLRRSIGSCSRSTGRSAPRVAPGYGSLPSWPAVRLALVRWSPTKELITPFRRQREALPTGAEQSSAFQLRGPSDGASPRDHDRGKNIPISSLGGCFWGKATRQIPSGLPAPGGRKAPPGSEAETSGRRFAPPL